LCGGGDITLIEVAGASECGSVGGGLLQALLVAQDSHVDREAHKTHQQDQGSRNKEY
jgi:hypothetical protein